MATHINLNATDGKTRASVLPTIDTRRLYLRPFQLVDAHRVQRLAGERNIAYNTLAIPYPYEDGMAESWIASHATEFKSGRHCILAISLRDNGELIGAIGLGIEQEHRRAELGYWIGSPFWNRGYASEAAAAMLKLGFENLGLHRIHANHFTRNPASGRVLRKIGMKLEGRLREHIYKWTAHEDIDVYGLLSSEWQSPDPPDAENKSEESIK